MSDHAILSPSGATRWLSCTPSARLELSQPDKAGDAAREGTLAHKLAELILSHKTKLISKVMFNRGLKEIQADKLYTKAMHDHCDDYSVYVLEQFAKAQAQTSDAQLFLEQKFDLTAYIPEGFGTTDSNIVADKTLYVIDLKYGKGVPVSAVNNKQMMIYALGSLHEFDFMYNIENVHMTIFQPRLDNISVWEISVKELRNWAATELKPLAAQAYKGEGEFIPGNHCQFCRVKPTCKAYASFNLELAKYDFKSEVLLKDDEVSDVLSRAAEFKSWIKAVEDYALEQAVNNGKKWPGFKLVAGRSNRKYSDEDTVAEVLIKNGRKKDEIYKPAELLGITDMESLLGKKTFAEYLAGLIIKPDGKPTLAPADDPRAEYHSATSAKEDFADTKIS